MEIPTAQTGPPRGSIHARLNRIRGAGGTCLLVRSAPLIGASTCERQAHLFRRIGVVAQGGGRPAMAQAAVAAGSSAFPPTGGEALHEPVAGCMLIPNSVPGECAQERPGSSDSSFRGIVAGWLPDDVEPPGSEIEAGVGPHRLEIMTDAVGSPATPWTDAGRPGEPEKFSSATPMWIQGPGRDHEGKRTSILRAGDQLAGFRILAELGRGAEGAVYLASQTDMADRPVVVKVCPLEGAEHRKLARLQHTHIVPILSSEDLNDQELRFLCFPYMGGTTLARILEGAALRPLSRRTGKDILDIVDGAAVPEVSLPAAGPAREFLSGESYERSIAWIGLCLAEALHHAHMRMLVHCDVKPENILLAADGMPLLLDFHLALPPVPAGGVPSEWIGGTPPYMAPEQFDAMKAMVANRPGPAVDGRADIYSLAMVLHIALTDERPNKQGKAAARLQRMNPRVSPGLAAILAKALSKEPHKRYPTSAAFAEDLRRHLDDEPLVGVANRSLREWLARWRRNHPIALARAAAVAVILLGLIAIGLIAWFAAVGRLSDAIGEFERGRLQAVTGDHKRADETIDRALLLLDSTAYIDRILPGARKTRDRLRTAREQNRRAEMVLQLHELAERVRFFYATGLTKSDAARKLEAQLALIWRERERIVQCLANEADQSTQGRLRADLLDLVILWAQLHIELADEAARSEAHREVLRTLAQAEDDCGPSPVLSEERRFHARAIGLQDEVALGAPEVSPRTAWECYALGRSRMRDGELESAAAMLDRAVALQPQSLWAQFYRGQCALRGHRYAEAIDAFGACVALAPEAACYYNRSLAYAGLGVQSHARLDLERARELDPSLVDGPSHSQHPTARH